ncbi:MAG: hypothetical protein UV79_C0022G0003 [candidate division TM6 bacterium GW2011_GWF2_43_17]|nr:MAG: hypothetical protein UV79_C0022G0003 [candidate division TM6 bacterium GW2011_GWF2_43_17]
MNKSAQQTQLFEFLEQHEILYRLFEHDPVFRVGETLQCQGREIIIPGAHTKNLFLQDQKSKQFFLVSVAEEMRVDLKRLAQELGVAKFSFGKPEDMYRLLAVEPGSVTPFGLLFDTAHEVTFVLDRNLTQAEFVCFHPLQNTATLQLLSTDFVRFVKVLGREIWVFKIPGL